MRKTSYLLFLFVAFFLSNKIYAQTCFGSFAGPNISLPCGTACTPFTAQIPEIRSTETYTVGSIPYNPYPYVTTAPSITYPCPSARDDRFTDIIPIGFNFCFFSQTHNSLVISTNGLVTFDLNNALKGSNWDLKASSGAMPIPFLGSGTVGSTSCLSSPTGVLYPRLSIMGSYQDIDIDKPSTNKKIEFRVEGIAPCRRAIISFFEIANWSCSAASNGTSTCEIVIYESTGIIEIYIKDKPNNCTWNDGNAIVGIQDMNPTVNGYAPPGRNLGSWGSMGMNEAWQFKPNGATSLLDHVELLQNGVFLTNGIVGTLNNGFYNVDFGTVCPPNQNNQYIVRGVYKTCNNDPTFYNIDDTVNIDRIIPFYANGSITKSILCNGDATAEVTFNPIGITNPYEFSKNGGTTYQTSGVFSNLSAGPNTFRIRDVNGCLKDTTINIPEPTALTLTAIQTQQSNCSNKTGEITLTAGGGTPAYEYSINGGITYQPGNVFSNLPVGLYNQIQIKDLNGCIRIHTPVNVTLDDTMRLELGPDSTICVGQTVLMLTQTNAETDTFKWNRITPLLDYDTAKTPIFSPIDTLKYKVLAKWGICSREDSIIINVKHKPIPDAGKDTSVCYKTFAYLNANATNLSGTVNYAWAPAAMVTPNNAANAIAWPDTSRYFYVTVTDNYGCNFSVVDSVKVTMRDPIPAFAGNDTIAMLNKPHQMEATGGVKFLWTPASPLNNPFIRMPLATLSHDQYFEVEVSDEIGCKATDGIFVKVYEGPTYHLPNAFSPNGDGLNEVFRPIPSGIQSTEYFRVFDRYGTLMFQTQEWMKGWNGNYQGKPALAGTYVWTIKGIDVNGAPVEMKGTVILIR